MLERGGGGPPSLLCIENIMITWIIFQTSWARTLWARSKFGLWYAAVGVVKMLHTGNKHNIRKLIQSPSKRILDGEW